MRWVKAIWNNLNPSVIANCWRHTGLLNTATAAPPSTPPSTANEEATDAEFIADFNNFLQVTNIQSAMTLTDFISPANEDAVQEQLTDEQIIEIVLKVDEDEEDEEELEPPSPYLNLPKQDKVISIAQTITFIENSPDGWKNEQQTVVRHLRRMQRDLRYEIIREREERSTQTSISSFFRRIE
jgi:hypothetical protein